MFSDKVNQVYDLWGKVLEQTGGVGQVHIDYQEFRTKRLLELGGNPSVTFGEMTDDEAEIQATVLHEWLAK